MQILDAIRLLLVIVCTIFTFLPFLNTGFWVVRFCDFPRHLVTAGACVAAAWSFAQPSYFDFGLGVYATCLALWQGSHVIKYTFLFSTEVPKSPSPNRGDQVRVAVANLQFENQMHESCALKLSEMDADVLLLIEINDDWSQALEPVRQQYAYRCEAVRENGLGMALWSRLPLESPEVRFLVSDDRPSIHTDITLDDGETFRFVGVHPTPPGLYCEKKNERADSRIRDAELILVAQGVSQQPDRNWIVTGDFNDVAWSHTTRLFKRLSGLRDPRVGRGLYNTYHAKKPFLRFPIDHVFVSRTAQLIDMHTFHPPGSDHRGILIDLHFVRIAQQNSANVLLTEDRPIEGDEEDAEQLISEGLRDASLADAAK